MSKYLTCYLADFQLNQISNWFHSGTAVYSIIRSNNASQDGNVSFSGVTGIPKEIHSPSRGMKQ